MSDEDVASGDDWDSDRNEAEDEDRDMPDADDGDDADESSGEEDVNSSLIVKLKLPSRSAALPESKGDDVVNANGSLTPAETEDAKGGALNGDGAPTSNGLLTVHPGSSPTGPSGYPTPASSSFPIKNSAIAPPGNLAADASMEHIAPPSIAPPVRASVHDG